MNGSSGGGGTQQVVQTQKIPDYEQQFSQENQDLARSLASNPYPQYQGALIQPFSDLQNQALAQLPGAVNSYQPYLDTAIRDTGVASDSMARALNINPANSAQVASYMSPYVQQALQPQILAAQQQLAQQQNATNASATMNGAFGDARNGVANALNNFYGNQTMAGIEGQGYNTAFQNAMSSMLGEQANQLQGANAQLAVGQQMGNLGNLSQNLGLNANNALFSGGAQQQQLGQQELNTAYQQFLNQSQWPYQMLGLRESAISNNPYTIQNATQLPNANTTAQGLGAFASLAGIANSLGGKNGIFGGA